MPEMEPQYRFRFLRKSGDQIMVYLLSEVTVRHLGVEIRFVIKQKCRQPVFKGFQNTALSSVKNGIDEHQPNFLH